MPQTDQNPCVPETMESSRRWSGFVCPDCRFVFRVPRDHDGRAIVCPSCRRMLRIPTSSDTPPPLVISLRSVAAEAAAAKAAREEAQSGNHRKKSRKSEEQGWDKSQGGGLPSAHEDKRQMFWWFIGGATLFASIITVVLMAMLGGDKAKPAAVVIQAPAAPPPTAPIPEEDPATALAQSDAEFLTKAEVLAKKFTQATNIEDMLPLVRNPDLAEGRMKKFYPDGKIEALGMTTFNTTSRVLRMWPIIAVMVRNRDFVGKPLYFYESTSGIKIDWESWVGWSEVSWEDFLATKPQAPKLFRVTLSAVQYYNFYFADEKRWQSYRIESPDRKHSIYGYVERNSPLNARLMMPNGMKQMALTLKLRFPADTLSPNQVIIDNFVAEGWVLETEPSQ